MRNLINLLELSHKKIRNSLISELENRLYNIFGANVKESQFFLELTIINPHLLIEGELPEEGYKEAVVYSNDKIQEPNEFSRWVIRKGHVRFLDLHSWKLFRIPESKQFLSHLNYLNLRANNLRSFPKCLLKLKRLKKLNLTFNYKLKRFSKYAYIFAKQNLAQKYINEGVVPEEAPMLGLFEMLTGYKLKREEDKYESIRLFELNKSGHVLKLEILESDSEVFSFSFIPYQISFLAHLEELKILFNSIIYLPDTLGMLKHLRILDLRHNLIRKIPQSIGNISSLQILDLSWNTLQTIPETILQLKSLRHVSISAREISPKVKDFFDLNKNFIYTIK